MKFICYISDFEGFYAENHVFTLAAILLSCHSHRNLSGRHSPNRELRGAVPDLGKSIRLYEATELSGYG
jgi:hypothetical protein